MTNKDLKILKAAAPHFAEEHGMDYVALFGSTARGEQTKKSDIDLLVKFKKPVSLIRQITIQRKLARKLGKKVDLVTVKALHPKMKQYIKSDLKILYEGK